MTPTITWPEGKEFAFTMFDDTERGTVENNRAIYSLFKECGIRITKSVWPLAGPGTPDIPGPTCEEPEYLALCLELQSEGFEIAMHNATYHTSDRMMTFRAFDLFREYFSHDPHTLANHSSNREGIYWGPARLSGWRETLYRIVQRGQKFRGHIQGDPLFWGDVCQQRVRYVRNLVFAGLNTLAACPMMPYHDPAKPFVNHWFASADATDVAAFNRNVTPAALDALAAQGGACILYTHLGKRFYGGGQLNAQFEQTIRRLGKMNGWFVPVATLLDFLASQQPAPHVLTNAERCGLEIKWMRDQLLNLRNRLKKPVPPHAATY